MTVVTRFAPSPTGFLHIGSARTALFNWLYAKAVNGKFYLRIEDTDKERSTNEAIDTILKSMKWLGLDWDGDVIYQSHREMRHREVALELLRTGKAYKCFATQEEIAQFRTENPHQKFQSPWRNKHENEYPKDQNYVVRIKAPLSGVTVVKDIIKGEVVVNNGELDDMVLLRSDQSPTYMLAVVVDDHDMNVNCVIRGEDHFTNTFRQRLIIDALSWEVPIYAHIPLIHGSDGAKLSKRHGALGVHLYEEMGYLPEAMNNYLLRLGWSHGDDEIISAEYAKKIFNLENIGSSPSKFDIEKLNFLNAHYIVNADDNYLLEHVQKILKLDSDIAKERILKGMAGLKVRAKTIVELAEGAKIYVEKQKLRDEKSISVLEQGGDKVLLNVEKNLQMLESWSLESLKAFCKQIADEMEIKESFVMQSLRAGVLGTFNSPSILEVMLILGKDETLKRISESNGRSI